ncbi:hypothetical protein CTEN210_07663 [Chaetoceros tenuissimus]|uniref:SET domain-containing protein n=1 Tax=Chaetoceros tenuissimus TaxID=426638 RepID=A0AAD3CSC1_9STRA|nr:hypothetical protein CTEN210_07663 [Chaetoceros tenuissimus]
MRLGQAITVLTAVATFGLSGVNAEADKAQYHNEALFKWVKSSNGFIHPSLEMRRADPSDSTSMFGLFATGDIKEDTQLFNIPSKLVMKDPTGAEIEAMQCGLVYELIDHLKKKDESEFAPYVNYLLDTQPAGQLPSAWSDAGRELFMQILGHEGFTMEEAKASLPETGELDLENTLAPGYPIGWIENEWYGLCDGPEGELEEYAAMIVIQRAWDNILIPLYDMVNHRNGKWLNTKSDESGVHSGKGVNVLALRDIKKGEQIYSTYNMCEDCGGRVKTYGTAEILRDYGFVEEYPQTWIFQDIDADFRIDTKGIDDDGETIYEITEWINGEPDEQDLVDLKAKLEEVEYGIKLLGTKEDHPDVSEYEYAMMVEYMEAMKTAFTVASEWEDSEKMCVVDGSCSVTLDRYTDLDVEYNTSIEPGYMDSSCDLQRHFHKYDDGTYLDLESYKSQYQTITFMYTADNNAACMDLDDTVQICDDYRPHYHEYAVHTAARFLPKNGLKRALFVGGGDSMLLHELLKYESIELIVGLELDQKVTRGSYKHFGTQPHFDDDRVEWWFGDATKSLMMIPKEYFASFDLVLVDLSETVMSFKVSDELDIFEALTLLVKPDGIFVKNEVYFDVFKEIFPYTALMRWYDVPVVCAQVMVMGSRTIDFMKQEMIEQDAEKLIVKDLKDTEDEYEIVHHYSRNMNIVDKYCGHKRDDSKQTDSPGIAMLVEVDEEVDVDISIEAVEKALQKNFNVIKSVRSDMDEFSVITTILKEGYITLRLLPKKKYAGFDIHLWGSFTKHETALNDMLGVLNVSKSNTSSYRLIAGGMFGVDTWKEDNALRGPQFSEICEIMKDSVPTPDKKPGRSDASDVMDGINTGLSLLNKKNLKIAVLVGNGESAPSSYENASEIVEIGCESMLGFNEFGKFAKDNLQSCETHLFKFLKQSAHEKKFDAMVISESAEKMTSSVLLALLSTQGTKFVDSVFSKNSLIFAASTDGSGNWKKNFMKHFADEVFIDEPAAFAEVLLQNTSKGGQVDLYIVNDDDEYFVQKLNAKVTEINNDETSIQAIFNGVSGGAWLFQDEFVPSTPFTPDDFNQIPSLTQWDQQSPIGHQIILQFEANGAISKEVTPESLKKAIIMSMDMIEENSVTTDSIEVYADLGEGLLLTTFWSHGTLSVLYDGKTHIDVNILTLDENVKAGDILQKTISNTIKPFKIRLRDEQPRGNGRTVAYQRDLNDTPKPRWAPKTS